MVSPAASTTPAVSLLSSPKSVVLKVSDLEEDPKNARLTFEKAALQSLADSIKAQGLLQPLVVRAVKGGKHRIIDGHRRKRAAELAGLKDVRCEVVELDDQAAALAAATANLQREDLTPYEQARVFQHALDLGMTKRDLCEWAGIVFNTLKARLQLLELPEAIGRRIGVDGFAIGHAQALLPLKDSPKLLETAVAFVDAEQKKGELPDAEDLPEDLARVLGEKGLVREVADVDEHWQLDGLEKAAAKLPAVTLKTGYSHVRLITDTKAFDAAVDAERTALVSRKAKAAAKKPDEKKTKGPSVDMQAKRGLRNVQAQLMAEHVAKLDKWTDELQILLFETVLARAGGVQRTKDSELRAQAAGLTEDEAMKVFTTDDGVRKLWKSKPKNLQRLVAACLFFANQSPHHELVGDRYEAIYRCEDPAAKILTGKTYGKTVEDLKDRIKSEKAGKPAKSDAKPASKAAPTKKATQSTLGLVKAKAKLAKSKGGR